MPQCGMELARWLKGMMGPQAAPSTGVAGERQAEAFLKKRGYRMLARNWRDPRDLRDELDLVFCDGKVLVFVEVKTRSAHALVSGYYTINRRKKKVLLRAAKAYLKSLAPSRRPCSFRLDVVEIEVGPGPAQSTVRHFENVPLFPKHYRP